MAAHAGPNIIEEGLVLCLDAGNERSYPGSGTTWTDLSGNNYNMTLYNSPAFNSGGFITFDGVNQYGYHSTPGLNSSSASYTFEIVFRMKTLPTAQYAANGHIYGGQNGNNLVLYLNPAVSGESELNMIYDDSRYTATSGGWSTQTAQQDEWVHWSVTGTPTVTVNHYKNGTFDVTRTMYAARGWSSGTYLGRDTRWSTFTNMDVATIRRYSRALSAGEIAQNFAATRGRYGI